MGAAGRVDGRPAAKRDGANSGTLAVRGSIFLEVMEEWQQIDETEPVRTRGFGIRRAGMRCSS